jgi:DNA-binding MarR family transcriptional regulator
LPQLIGRGAVQVLSCYGGFVFAVCVTFHHSRTCPCGCGPVPTESRRVRTEAFKDFTGDGDVQIQTVQTFLKIVLAGGATANFDDIAKATGVSQAAVPRNIKKMAEGPRQTEGYGLIHVELDPYDSRRRIITLSPRGKELAASMEARMMPGMLRYLAKQGVRA